MASVKISVKITGAVVGKNKVEDFDFAFETTYSEAELMAVMDGLPKYMTGMIQALQEMDTVRVSTRSRPN